MPNILALDTSAGACSVALHYNNHTVEQSIIAARAHTQHILPMVDAVLAEGGCRLAQLDAIAFGAGPGSFTGLRIACGVAQGLAFGANLPLVPVSSLAAIAAAVFQCQPEVTHCLASFDARMQQIYAGVYHNVGGLPQLVGDEVVIEPCDYVLPAGLGPLFCAGSGMAFQADMPALKQTSIMGIDVAAQVSASAVLRLGIDGFEQGQHIAPEAAEPVYLRQQVSWQKQT